MRHILAAIDLDAHAPTVLALARAVAGPESRIRLVHAYQPAAAAALSGSSAPTSREASLDALRKHAEAIPGAEHKPLDGPPARAIIEEARAWRADTIVVAPTSRSRVERFLMGSVSSEVLRNADANVLLARPTASTLRRLLICTDLHEPSRRAAIVAARLAERTSAQSTLLFAADPAFWGPNATAPWPPEAYEIDSDWLDRAHQEALHKWLRSKLEEFNARHLGGRSLALMKEGSPKEVILQEAFAHDLVIMGTHGPNVYERAVVGSVAEHVAAHASTSVLVVKK